MARDRGRYHVHSVTQPVLWALSERGGTVRWAYQPGRALPRPQALELARRAAHLLGRAHVLEAEQ